MYVCNVLYVLCVWCVGEGVFGVWYVVGEEGVCVVCMWGGVFGVWCVYVSVRM